MKKSDLLIILTLMGALVPAIFIKLNLWTKHKNKEWVFYSSRGRIDATDIKSIELNQVASFRYQYHPDSTYLEYNTLNDKFYSKSKQNGLLTISSIKPTPALQGPPRWTTPSSISILYSIFSDPDQPFIPSTDMFTFGTSDIIYYGPVCPPIKATETTFFIDSVGPGTSFTFDLEFSSFHWENYYKDTDGKIDKKLTKPWYLNELNLKLDGSIYYFADNIYFNKVNIKAIHKTSLDFDGDHFEEAIIEVDPSVIVRAPVSIWNKLKLNLSK